MKKTMILALGLSASMLSLRAQLYSSGNTTIGGSNVGIGVSSPTAKLHAIQSVRFQNLSRLDTPPRVLTQDTAGYLYWSPISIFTPPPPPAMVNIYNSNGTLTGHRTMNMNQKDLTFLGPKADVTVGDFSLASIMLDKGKFNVIDNEALGRVSGFNFRHGLAIGVYSDPNVHNINRTGMKVDVMNSKGDNAYGSHFLVRNLIGQNSIGSFFEAFGSGAKFIGTLSMGSFSWGRDGYRSIGAKGHSEPLMTVLGATGSTGTGGEFSSKSANSNRGVEAYAYADPINPDPNYGILAEVTTPNSMDYAGMFVGDVFATGVFTSSDEKLKKNIKTFSDGLSVINALKIKTYEYNLEKYKDMNFPSGTQVGLMAGELEKLVPSAIKQSRILAGQEVKTDKVTSRMMVATDETFKAVNYTALIPYHINATQTLSQKLEDQELKLEEQRKEIEELKNLVQKLADNRMKELNQEVTGNQSAFIAQNVPNPFADYTSIEYFIPKGARETKITVVTLEGKLVKTYVVEHEGKGIYNIRNSELAEGNYIYSLWINGVSIDAKRMQVLLNK
jgi:hypothetical protein